MDNVRRLSTAIRRPTDAPLAEVIEELFAAFEMLPRIEQPNIEAPKVLHIAGDEGQVMLNGRCRDLRVGCGRATAGKPSGEIGRSSRGVVTLDRELGVGQG